MWFPLKILAVLEVGEVWVRWLVLRSKLCPGVGWVVVLAALVWCGLMLRFDCCCCTNTGLEKRCEQLSYCGLALEKIARLERYVAVVLLLLSTHL